MGTFPVRAFAKVFLWLRIQNTIYWT
jgi:hypothetical protein